MTDTIADYVRKYLAAPGQNVVCHWQLLKVLPNIKMECWQIGKTAVIIQQFRKMEGMEVFFASPSNYMEDDMPLMAALKEKAEELQTAREKVNRLSLART